MQYIQRNAGFLPPYPNMQAPYHSSIGMYPPNGYYQAPMQMQMGHMNAQQYLGQQYGGNNMPNQLFHNPLQIEEDHLQTPYTPGGYTHPYQMPGQLPKPQTGHFNSFLNSFKSQSGTLDLNKMMDTAGQMMNALTQVSNMAKGIGGLFKA
ncbi:Uncharacterised protein [Bacillus freudenreichii]|nr:Uncharacterised protein [Bacillus freudenreichii]